MYLNGKKLEITDRGYKPYLTVPNRVGGMCLIQSDVDWFTKWIRLNECNSYLEIGVFDGILISLLAEEFPNMICYGVDPFEAAGHTGGGHWEYFYVNNKDFDNVYFYRDKSQVILPKLLEEGLHFDLIFVDGDHSYEACKSDFKYSFELLSPNGVMVLHDADKPSVIQAIKEFEKPTFYDSEVTGPPQLHIWEGFGMPLIFKGEKNESTVA